MREPFCHFSENANAIAHKLVGEAREAENTLHGPLARLVRGRAEYMLGSEDLRVLRLLDERLREDLARIADIRRVHDTEYSIGHR